MCFSTDFPSAQTLRGAGIRGVVLLQSTTALPRDLSYILERWQRAELSLFAMTLEPESRPQAMHLEEPSWYSELWYRVRERFGRHRGELGGFGGYIESALG